MENSNVGQNSNNKLKQKMSGAKLKVLYIHGRNSNSKTEKAVHLSKYFEVFGEDILLCSCYGLYSLILQHMDTTTGDLRAALDRCVLQQTKAIEKFKPDIVVCVRFVWCKLY